MYIHNVYSLIYTHLHTLLLNYQASNHENRKGSIYLGLMLTNTTCCFSVFITYFEPHVLKPLLLYKKNENCFQSQGSYHIIQEVVTRMCFAKKVFLKILHKAQKNTCVRASFFNKIVGMCPVTLSKKRLPAQVLPCEFCEIFKSTFLQNPSVAASGY